MFASCASACSRSSPVTDTVVVSLASMEDHAAGQEALQSREHVGEEARLADQQESHNEMRVASSWFVLSQQAEEAWARAGVEDWMREQREKAETDLQQREAQEAHGLQREADERAAAVAESAGSVVEQANVETDVTGKVDKEVEAAKADEKAQAAAEAEAAAEPAAEVEVDVEQAVEVAAEAEAGVEEEEGATFAEAEAAAVAEAEATAAAVAEAEAADRAQAEAAANQRKESVQAFLQSRGFKGVVAPKRTLTKTTYALHEAAKLGNADMAQMLILEGADPRQKNSRGKTAVQRARDADKNGSHSDVISLLEGACRAEARVGGA